MNIDKDNAMLIDIQYVRANRAKNLPDMLYIIWKDLETGEKHLETIPNPSIPIYFLKPEYRNFDYIKTEEKLSRLYKRVVPYNQIYSAIAKEDGPEAQKFLSQCFQTRNFRAIEEIMMSKWAFGHDYDIRTIYRNEWLNKFDNDKIKHIDKAYGDIEVDILESSSPDPQICPVDLVTIIDGTKKHVYTFCLTGVEFKPKKHTMTLEEMEAEKEREEMYKHRQKEQDYWRTHPDKLSEEIHNYFDEKYPEFEYNVYFYNNEAQMITHLFDLIHLIKPDFLMFWNIRFDIPYLIERARVLGLDPTELIPHPDFQNKQCYFKKDNHHFTIKNKTDFFCVTDYTVYIDQMLLYAAIRKGGDELRSNALTKIAEKEIGDSKLDYSEEATIKTLSYRNWLLYLLYNIKDVFLQYGIEEVTSDIDTLYVYSYENSTQYENVFKQTVKLRNIQYGSWLKQGYVPGPNINAILNRGFVEDPDEDDEEVFDDDLEDGKKKKKKDVNFEGALVGNPLLISYFGSYLFHKRTNNIFRFSIDMDMTAFYPSTIMAMNIYPPCLIFKMILDASEYNVRGGSIPFNGITDVQMVKNQADSFTGDVAKECIDNFATKNYISFAHKWMNFPSVAEVCKALG